MSLGDFFKQFPDEASSRAFIEQERWGGAVATCPRCGDMTTYRIAGVMGFKCSGCKGRFSVRTGTPIGTIQDPVAEVAARHLHPHDRPQGHQQRPNLPRSSASRNQRRGSWEHRIRAADESYPGGKGKNMHKVDRKRHIGGGRVMARARLNVRESSRLGRGKGVA